MNILVIGVAGFIGSHLAKRLDSIGYRVYGVDIDGARAKHVVGSNITFTCCDFGSQSAIKNVLQQCNIDVVIQCAGISSIKAAVVDPMKCYTNDVLCNVFLMHTMIEASVRKFIYISSASVFGEVDKLPIDRNTARAPINPIGNSQLFVENMLESLRISHGLTYAIARTANITGMSEIENEYFVKNLGEGLIPNIIKHIIGEKDAIEIFGETYETVDTTAERDYIHVDDFCNACMNILPKLAVKGENFEYNIGSGKKYSVKEVIEIAENVFGVKIKTIPGLKRIGDASRLYFDVYKARNELDWFPKYDSLESIFKTILPYYAGKQKQAL